MYCLQQVDTEDNLTLPPGTVADDYRYWQCSLPEGHPGTYHVAAESHNLKHPNQVSWGRYTIDEIPA